MSGLPPWRVAVLSAMWTARSLASAKRQLERGRPTVRLSDPPVADTEATRLVRALVKRAPVTCLAQSYVLQRWYLAIGDPRDVVVAVTKPSDGFKAHAWLDGDPKPEGFAELTRRVPPVRQ